MTTGCICSTPGCQGLASERDGVCDGCQIEAMPRGAARTVRRIIHNALYGPELTIDDLTGGRNKGREAGS
jgi:hypothetical protein